ncbi:MAG: hypothetical protein WCO23_00295 [bacterium]
MFQFHINTIIEEGLDNKSAYYLFCDALDFMSGFSAEEASEYSRRGRQAFLDNGRDLTTEEKTEVLDSCLLCCSTEVFLAIGQALEVSEEIWREAIHRVIISIEDGSFTCSEDNILLVKEAAVRTLPDFGPEALAGCIVQSAITCDEEWKYGAGATRVNELLELLGLDFYSLAKATEKVMPKSEDAELLLTSMYLETVIDGYSLGAAVYDLVNDHNLADSHWFSFENLKKHLEMEIYDRDSDFSFLMQKDAGKFAKYLKTSRFIDPDYAPRTKKNIEIARYLLEECDCDIEVNRRVLRNAGFSLDELAR